MRHKQELDYEGLRAAAEQAVEKSGMKRVEVAEALGVSKGSISRALNNSGSVYSKLQISILEHYYPDYRVVERTVFQTLRRDRT